MTGGLSSVDAAEPINLIKEAHHWHAVMQIQSLKLSDRRN
jgi:hypothetical protein